MVVVRMLTMRVVMAVVVTIIMRVVIWAEDIGNAGIEEATA